MGIAAYNRSSAAGREILKQMYPQQSSAAHIMERINNLQKTRAFKKYEVDARLNIKWSIVRDHRGAWWLSDAADADGYGVFYRTLDDAVRSNPIELTGYNYITRQWFAMACRILHY